MSHREILREQLETDEGIKDFAYQDSEGYWTIGIGHLIDKRKGGKVSEAVIQLMFDEDVTHAEAAALRLVPTFETLSDARKAVLCNMAFQLGERGLGGFHDMLHAVAEGRWDDAAAEMLASTWASQTPARAIRLAHAMREG